MKIGIVGALEEELASTLALLENRETTDAGVRQVLSGTYGEHTILVVRSDVGKVNATLATQFLIDQYTPDCIVNLGSSGAVSNVLDVGDLVIATGSMHHDFDLRDWGVTRGDIMFDVSLNPQGGLNYTTQKLFKTDTQLSELASRSAFMARLHPVGGRLPIVHKGVIISGDAFVSDRTLVQELSTEFGALCVDMESAAVAQTCAINQVPCLIIRTISDRADRVATVSFVEYLETATLNYASLMERILQHLDDV